MRYSLDDTIRHIKKDFPLVGISMVGPVESMIDFENNFFVRDPFTNNSTLNRISAADLNACWHLLYMITMHARSGEPVFRLSPELVDMLLATDIPKVESSLLKLPFPCIKLDISKTPLLICNSQAVYIFISHTDRFRIYYACDDSTGIYSNLVTMDDPEVKTIYDSFCVTIARATKAKTSGNIDHQVCQALACATNNKHWSEESDKFHKEYKRLLTLSINAILYITSAEADLTQENMKNIEELQRKINKMKAGFAKDHITKIFNQEKQKCIYIVGKSLKPMYGTNNVKPGNKINFRHQVRGHWKMVPYGKNAEQRRQKWIMPYWRGPDMAEIIARNYVVRTPNIGEPNG